MLGAVMGRIQRRRAGRCEHAGWTRRLRSTALVGLTFVVAACGNDRGKPFAIPAGEEFDEIPANRVLVVVESRNECAGADCVPVPSSPCDLGAGNQRGLAVYRLGTGGRLVSHTGDRAGALPEEIIPTADNPRRVISHPNDPSLLYVATLGRIQVFRLASGGGSTCIGETLTDAELDPNTDPDVDLDPLDLVIDPAFGTNGVLYLAAKGANRVDAYDIALDGTLPALPSSCIVGSTAAEFSALAPMTETLFATGGRNRIEIYERVDGQFPDVQNPPTPTFTPEPDQLTPTPITTPAPTGPTPIATPSPAPTCVEALLITSSLSALGAALVNDIEFLPSTAPDDQNVGNLIIAEEASQRLTSFPVDPNGIIDNNDNGRTNRAGFYQRILRADRSAGTFLYASALQEGKTDVYKVGDPERGEDVIASQPISKTRSDPFSLPVGLAIDGDTGSILYVAQGGLGRVDGFRIRPDGGTDEMPVTSTAPTQTLEGATTNLFPDDVVIVPLS